jgi:predicted protein tyrosine phosphatase
MRQQLALAAERSRDLVLVRWCRCFLVTVSATKKLLFVCSRNRLRSLTAEKLFEGSPQYQVRSAGTQPDARIVVTEGHLGWADTIFCMEKSHVDRLRRRFSEALQGKRVVCLHIPDDYEFMHPGLLEELRAKLGQYVSLPDETDAA